MDERNVAQADVENASCLWIRQFKLAVLTNIKDHTSYDPPGGKWNVHLYMKLLDITLNNSELSDTVKIIGDFYLPKDSRYIDAGINMEKDNTTYFINQNLIILTKSNYVKIDLHFQVYAKADGGLQTTEDDFYLRLVNDPSNGWGVITDPRHHNFKLDVHGWKDPQVLAMLSISDLETH